MNRVNYLREKTVSQVFTCVIPSVQGQTYPKTSSTGSLHKPGLSIYLIPAYTSPESILSPMGIFYIYVPALFENNFADF